MMLNVTSDLIDQLKRCAAGKQGVSNKKMHCCAGINIKIPRTFLGVNRRTVSRNELSSFPESFPNDHVSTQPSPCQSALQFRDEETG